MKEIKIKVWIARNKNGELNMFLSHPVRLESTWVGHGERSLDDNDFPYVDWASEPITRTMKLVEGNGNEEI